MWTLRGPTTGIGQIPSPVVSSHMHPKSLQMGRRKNERFFIKVIWLQSPLLHFCTKQFKTSTTTKPWRVLSLDSPTPVGAHPSSANHLRSQAPHGAEAGKEYAAEPATYWSVVNSSKPWFLYFIKWRSNTYLTGTEYRFKGDRRLQKCYYAFLLKNEPKSDNFIDCLIYHQMGRFCFHKPLYYFLPFLKKIGMRKG